MKETDCNKNQVYNPMTKRCVGKDTKKGIELLFNKKNKSILKLYELINGKIMKKCNEGKIRNPETLKCIKKVDKKVEKKVDKKVDEERKIEAIKRARKALSPFINRVSADIYRRNKYLMLMRRELRNINKEGCLRVYRQNPDGSYKYRIGNRIILNKRIGSNSSFGIVYLSDFREKTKKIFTFATKIYMFDKTKTEMELKLLTKLTDVVRMNECPHFPIFYGYILCENYLDFKDDNFKKSNSKDISLSQTISKMPQLIMENKNEKFISIFNELANGDLKSFFRIYIDNYKLLINALIQQILSLLYFIYHTNRLHKDIHDGNFLFYKIKAGGYFHYNICGKDYYLENLGFLWVIWDYDFSIDFDKLIKSDSESSEYKFDIHLICLEYISHEYSRFTRHKGFNQFTTDKEEILTFASIIVDKLLLNKNTSNKAFNLYELRELFKILPATFCEIKIKNENYFFDKLPQGEKVINKKSFKIEYSKIFDTPILQDILRKYEKEQKEKEKKEKRQGYLDYMKFKKQYLRELAKKPLNKSSSKSSSNSSKSSSYSSNSSISTS